MPDAISFLLAENDKLRQRVDELRAKVAYLDALLSERRGSTSYLSQREFWILVMVAQGYSNQKIATRLCIAERTVRTHVSNILDKLDLQNRTQAALHAWRNGLVPIDEAWETVMTAEWRELPPDE